MLNVILYFSPFALLTMIVVLMVPVCCDEGTSPFRLLPDKAAFTHVERGSVMTWAGLSNELCRYGVRSITKDEPT